MRRYSFTVAGESEIFANFERMRREIDELFGDVWQRAGYVPYGRPSFTPRVDVYSCGEPRNIVVVIELAGVDVGDVNLEVQGRELVITGRRQPHRAEGRDYQQVEIESGYFERRVDLGCDVKPEGAKAVYEDGMLRIELPALAPESRPRRVPINEREDG